jgi:hypothetical protein
LTCVLLVKWVGDLSDPEASLGEGLLISGLRIKDFAGVENAVGVEHALDFLLQFQLRVSEFFAQPTALENANAVLSGERATKFEGSAK